MSTKLWENEPDEERGEVQGLPYAIIRHPNMKHLCGYVAVPPGHPLHGKHYNAVEGADVHGGLTYAGKWLPGASQASRDWWFGFDCAHYGDLIPGFPVVRAMPTAPRDEIYRDMQFVRDEVRSLAAWLGTQSK